MSPSETPSRVGLLITEAIFAINLCCRFSLLLLAVMGAAALLKFIRVDVQSVAGWLLDCSKFKVARINRRDVHRVSM